MVCSVPIVTIAGASSSFCTAPLSLGVCICLNRLLPALLLYRAAWGKSFLFWNFPSPFSFRVVLLDLMHSNSPNLWDTAGGSKTSYSCMSFVLIKPWSIICTPRFLGKVTPHTHKTASHLQLGPASLWVRQGALKRKRVARWDRAFAVSTFYNSPHSLGSKFEPVWCWWLDHSAIWLHFTILSCHFLNPNTVSC